MSSSIDSGGDSRDMGFRKEPFRYDLLSTSMPEDSADNHDNRDHSIHQMDQTVDHKDNIIDRIDHGMNHDHSGMNGSMGMGTIMYMDGFHSALFSSSETPLPCLNLFSPSWTLDSKGKFVLAMFFITLLGTMVEVCGVWRVKCLRRGKYLSRIERMKRFQTQPNQQRQLSGDSSQSGQCINTRAPVLCPGGLIRAWSVMPPFVRDFVSRYCYTKDPTKEIKRFRILAALLHALRVWLGYLLMLAVMSYAFEFLFCTMIGMVLGRYWFTEVEDNDDGSTAAEENRKPCANVQDGMWGGGDPCCGIDDNDEDLSTNDNLDMTSEVETMLMQNELSQPSNMNEPLLGQSLSRRNVT